MIRRILGRICAISLSVLLFCMQGSADDFVIITPPMFEGSAAINPASRSLIPAAGSVTNETGLEAVAGLAAIHDFDFTGNASTTNSYIFDAWLSGASDVRLKYSGSPIGTVATTAGTYSTSTSGALRLQAGLSSAVSLRIDFGTWSDDVFLSNQVTEAAGLTLCTSGNSSSTVQVYVVYYGANGTPLSTQRVSTASVTAYHFSAYTSSVPISGIVVSYTNSGWAPVVTIDDLAYVSRPWIWTNPPLVSGTDAIDPPGGTAIKVNASGSASQAAVEAVAGFSAIQNWDMGPSWASSGISTNRTGIIAFTNFSRPDVSLRFKGLVGAQTGNRISNSVWATSSPTSLRIVAPSGGQPSDASLTLDFGEWNESGFDEKSCSVKAAALTVSAGNSTHWQNVGSLQAKFIDPVGNTLCTQQVEDSSWGLLRNTNTSGAVYFGYISAYTNISSIEIMITASNGAILGVDDLGFTPCNLFAESFAGQVERLRGVSGDRAAQLDAALDDAVAFRTNAIWARATNLTQLAGAVITNNGVVYKFLNTYSKYSTATNTMSEACALQYAYACNDIGLSSIILTELPYMAAAYRLRPDSELRVRLIHQFYSMTNWVPFQRPGWTLASSTNPQPDVVDGVFLATGDTIQALTLALNILPADFFVNHETLRQRLCTAVSNEIRRTHSDWTNEVPWYVAAKKYDSNQWVVPAGGMVIGAAYLGKELYPDVYSYGVAQLTNSLNFVGSDGSMSEGYGYGLSYVMTSLLMTKRTMETAGDSQWGGYSCFTGMPVWAAMCLQPNSNVVNSFDWYDGQRSYGVQSLKDTLQQMGVVSDDSTSHWLLNNIYQDSAPTVFGLLCLGADDAVQSEPPLYKLFTRSPMFIWRNSWSNQLSSGIWVRGRDTRDYHDHWDRGHLNIIFNGQPVLIEAGTPGYANSNKSEYYDSVKGHNVLQVGTNIYPVKVPALLTSADGSRTNGTVTFVTVENSDSNKPYTWGRTVAWTCNSLTNAVTVTDSVISTQGANNLTFRWHLASCKIPTNFTNSVTNAAVDIPGGLMTLSGETVSTPRITFNLNFSNTPVAVTWTQLYDHTMKHGVTSNLHTVIEVRTTNAVSNLYIRTVISTNNVK